MDFLVGLAFYADRRYSESAIFRLSHRTAQNGSLVVCSTPKNMFYADQTKNRYNFDSFTPEGCRGLGCLRFYVASKGREVSAPD